MNTTSVDLNQTQVKEKKKAESPAKLIISGILGSFCYGLTDLFSNNESAALVKLGNVINDHFTQSLSGVAVPFVILIILGGVLCWIYQPSNRLDAFTRGFTVFAALNIVSPYHNQALAEKDQCAVVDKTVKVEPSKTRSKHFPQFQAIPLKKVAVVTLVMPADKRPEKIIVTYMDPATRQVIKEFATDTRFVITESKPLLVKIAAPGFRSMVFEYQPNSGKTHYTLKLEPSKVPLGIQEIFGPKRVSALQ